MADRMKILSPIDGLKEALPLIESGADELYCGVLIDDMELSCIRQGDQYRSNVSGIEELKKIVTIVKEKGKSIYVAFNNPHPDRRHIELIFNHISFLHEFGVDGFIIGNLNLLDLLKGHGFKLVASSLLETKNAETVDLLVNELGVQRVIFDRQVTKDDVKSVLKKFPKTEFEVFVAEAACRNLNGSCKWHFAAKELRNPSRHFCTYKFSTDRDVALALGVKNVDALLGRLKMPHFGCGICALPWFGKIGIDSVKIVGRGYPLEAKIKNVKFIKRAVDMLDDNLSEERYRKKAILLFAEVFAEQCKCERCYYPHFF